MMAHLLFVEEAIRDVQNRVKTLNSNSILEIKEEFETLSEAVNNFVGEEVPTYRKLIVESQEIGVMVAPDGEGRSVLTCYRSEG